MLRRDFIKSASIILGGTLFLDEFVFAIDDEKARTVSNNQSRNYHLHGHARSGCATRPEIAPFLEKGISLMPPW
jgi:hypothetical protein